MTLHQILISLGGGTGIVGSVVAFIRSSRFRTIMSRLFSNAVIDLTDSVKNLQSVVEAQGESIEWLRGELSNTKDELDKARKQLAKTEALAAENASLRSRIAELEAQVKKLEEELARRRGGRPKNHVADI